MIVSSISQYTAYIKVGFYFDKKERRTMLKRISFRNISIEDNFWLPKIRISSTVTAKACIDKCVNTGRIENFVNAAKAIRGEEHGEFQGIMFNDSDVYKVLEGIAYMLHTCPDESLKSTADDIIEKIASAQHEDGYINTYFTLAMPNGRWTDMNYHEMYCIGHLIEAGIAYYEATGNRLLLDVGIRAADCIYEKFYVGNIHWIPGHQEIELALIKLYFLTNDEKYLRLAEYLVDQRGHGYKFLDVIKPCIDSMGGRKYNQDDKPASELSEISGHAVRAMYYYSAITELAVLDNKSEFESAMDRVYASMLRNMYITGGIGQSRLNEGFTADYDLPNDSYCETCAAVGVVYWSSRMNRLKQKSSYMDIAEAAMFNGAVSGVSLSGDKFFYVNPLTSDGTHHRQEWYDCSCCPTQISRFIPSVGDYIYSIDENDTVYVNTYIQSKAEFECCGQTVSIVQKTSYPWNGSIEVSLGKLDKPITLKLRIPSWCRAFTLIKNGQRIFKEITADGYLTVDGISSNDTLVLDLEMPVRLVRSDERVLNNSGKTAVMRGPIVYCMEETDNPNISDYKLCSDSKFVTFEIPELKGMTALKEVKTGAVFVPYFAWDNREDGKMDVWVDFEEKNDGWLYR